MKLRMHPSSNIGGGRVFFETRLYLLLLTGLLLDISPVGVLAQAPAAKRYGEFYIQNFKPRDYGAAPQNWEVIQDQNGLIYAANQSGVLEYDGVSWRTIVGGEEPPVYSLSADADNRIYVGARGDFGFLTPDSVGKLRFQSLLSKLNRRYHDFTHVWHIVDAKDGVYFMPNEHLFYWANDTVRKVFPEHKFFDGLFLDGALYLKARRLGLVKVLGDTLVPVKIDSKIQSEQAKHLTPYGNGIFSYSINDKRFVLNGAKSIGSSHEINDYLKRNHVYNQKLRLANDQFVITTRLGGALIVDQQGTLVQLFNKNSGLQNNTAWSAFQDREGGLWLALDNGLSRVSIASPITRYEGFEGNVHDILRYKNQLFIATRTGVYFLDETSGVFRKVPGINSVFWDLSIFSVGSDPDKSRLLAAGADGVFEIKKDGFGIVRESVRRDFYTYKIHQSKADSALLFAGLINGVSILRRDQATGSWQELGKALDLKATISKIVETRPGELWTLHSGSRLFRTRYSPNSQQSQAPGFKTIIDEFGKGQRLGEHIRDVFTFNGVTYFRCKRAFHRFDENQNRFFETTIPGYSEKLPSGSRVLASSSAHIWLKNGGNLKLLNIGANNRETLIEKPFLPLKDYNITTVYGEKSGVAWFGGSDGLFRFDPTADQNYEVDFQTLIRAVSAGGDSVALNFSPSNEKVNSKLKNPRLSYSFNTMRFGFAATTFEVPERTEFQTFLEGFDKTWSGWTKSAQKEYTNLPEGDYRFRVRAKNLFGHLGKEAAFSFVVLPPWYRTWWAFLLYLFIASSSVMGLVRFRVRRLQKRTQELESLVGQRTRDVKAQRDQLRIQAQKLKELDLTKSRFFANISHEFRTPLTLILGQIGSVLPDSPTQAMKEKLDMAARNGKQLLRLINQLLDLSKLESGALKLHPQPGDILPLIKNLTYSFESLAHTKKIKLHFSCEHDAIFINFEAEKIEQIMHNLLSNAIKFTLEGGRISIQLAVNSDQKQDNQPNTNHFLLITVRDSGLGIPKDRLAHIFDRFYQVDGSQTREHEGTGIGLALTKELVELHGGQISVESDEGFGTAFFVTLPLVAEPGERGTETGARRAKDNDEIFHAGITPQLEPSGNNVVHPSFNLHSPTSSEFVLVVEDNADVRAYIRQHLEERYSVIEAKNGEEGFEKAREFIPDLIITDVMMPKIDGYELSRRLRTDKVTSHIPIIMVTAKAAKEEKLEGLKTGVDAYLIKPFSTKELNLRVEKLIEMRRKLREQFSKTLSTSPSAVQVSSLDEDFFENVKAAIEENLAEEDFGVVDLCKKVGMSQRQLQRKIKALTDHSPARFIRTMRLQRAKQLIEKEAGTITEIAYQVGYNNVSAFSKVFKEEFGKTPSAITLQIKSK